MSISHYNYNRMHTHAHTVFKLNKSLILVKDHSCYNQTQISPNIYNFNVDKKVTEEEEKVTKCDHRKEKSVCTCM